MALASNSGVHAAARSALNEGVACSLSSGLHHARQDEGAGFCTFNGLVIAAKKLLYEGVVGSVLILDLDAHCGGGTAQLIIGDERIAQVDVAVSPFDRYPRHVNSTLTLVDTADDYLTAIKRRMLIGIDPQHTVIFELTKDQWTRHAQHKARQAVGHPVAIEFLNKRLSSAEPGEDAQ